jgi:hypothetical protein
VSRDDSHAGEGEQNVTEKFAANSLAKIYEKEGKNDLAKQLK